MFTLQFYISILAKISVGDISFNWTCKLNTNASKKESVFPRIGGAATVLGVLVDLTMAILRYRCFQQKVKQGQRYFETGTTYFIKLSKPVAIILSLSTLSNRRR